MSKYADVILPLALPKRTYTYSIPAELESQLSPGMRVEVPFGPTKLYSGIVERIHSDQPSYKTKSLNAVLDQLSVVTPEQIQLWDWVSAYYCCTMGEVMNAALPGHLKLTSETKVAANPDWEGDLLELDAEEYLVAEALAIRPEISINDVRQILQKKTVLPVIQRLLQKGILFLREDLQHKYKPRKVSAVRLAEPYQLDPELLRNTFQELANNPRHLAVVMAVMTLVKNRPFALKKEVLDKSEASDSVLKTLVKKGILEVYDRPISRISEYSDVINDLSSLSVEQQEAVESIEKQFEEKNVVLLHGVTGSGKTRIYMELIHKTIAAGGQVLYLLPEIALTTQITSRMQQVFGSDIVVYHSKINYQQRVELWHGAASGKPVILAARSGVFLPFQNLKLIVIDEEHDTSFKQYDPAPRYNGRDVAIYLAGLHGAKILLGTATPAVESYFNAHDGKYGYFALTSRFGGSELPDIKLVDLREHTKAKRMQGIFAPELIEALQAAIGKGEQAIIFQNRRGYSPILQCNLCGWTAQCKHCDVSLTYHKQSNSLRCHYCGYRQDPVVACPACGSGRMQLLGFGTEKIEEELQLFLPDARLGRLDMDTAGTKNSMIAILEDFDSRRIDILVGTQMVTKGLDFENVAIVGVLGTDQLIKFPDFRSAERSFQLLTQVAGRAGRKQKRGQVLIQAFNPSAPVLTDVLNADYANFVLRELEERKTFGYPPFLRLIQITIRHKDARIAADAAAFAARHLREQVPDYAILGPVTPNYARLRGLFGQDILLKLPKSAQRLQTVKNQIRLLGEKINGTPGWYQVHFVVDVDPMG